MPGGEETRYRFVPTGPDLTRFFARYEQERALGGISSTLGHVSPRQRVDTIATILGLNTMGGWKRLGSESAERMWLRYLTPVLAETRESADALALAVNDGLPGAFEPAISPEPDLPQGDTWEPPDPPDFGSGLGEDIGRLALAWERLHNRLRRDRALQIVIALLAAAAILIGLVRYAGLDKRLQEWMGGQTVCTDCPRPPITGGDTAAAPYLDVLPAERDPDDPAGDTYRMAVALTLGATAQHGGSLTPRALAEFYAGESDVSDAPELFLDAMMRLWPEPPDLPLPRDVTGAQALRHYAAAFTGIEIGATTPVLPLDRDTPGDEQLTAGLAEFADGRDIPPVPTITRAPWPAWPRWLVFVPFVASIAIGWLTWRGAVAASLRNPPPGVTGARVELPIEALLLTAPAPARHLARAIGWLDPVAGRRLHADASVRATLARGGFMTAVNRRRPRPADYLFLVPRRRREDHEHDRVNRFVDALERGGLSLHAYDYDPDPRSLTRRDEDAQAREVRPLDLRGLRELHPDARLVLVTDGSELVDRFTLAPLAFVADELAAWPERMLLTPVPMSEWGEREMNLSDALAAPVGRATPEGFRDLSTAFGERRRPTRRSFAPAGGRGARARMQRVVSWLIETERRIGEGDPVAARPRPVRFDDAWLRSEAPPPAEAWAALHEELRDWLGPRAYHWLAACAAYPQLRYDITTYLGLRLAVPSGGIAVPLYDEAALAKLTLLPWFRLGHMPRWLRTDLLEALPPPARRRVRLALNDLLSGSPLLPAGAVLPPGAALPIWRAQAGEAEIPPDEVMADLLMDGADEPEIGGEVFDRVFGPHRDRVIAVRVVASAAAAAWGALAWWLWPDPVAAPHAAGAWLPLIGLVAASAAAALGHWAWRWWRPRRDASALARQHLAENPA